MGFRLGDAVHRVSCCCCELTIRVIVLSFTPPCISANKTTCASPHRTPSAAIAEKLSTMEEECLLQISSMLWFRSYSSQDYVCLAELLSHKSLEERWNPTYQNWCMHHEEVTEPEERMFIDAMQEVKSFRDRIEGDVDVLCSLRESCWCREVLRFVVSTFRAPSKLPGSSSLLATSGAAAAPVASLYAAA